MHKYSSTLSHSKLKKMSPNHDCKSSSESGREIEEPQRDFLTRDDEDDNVEEVWLEKIDKPNFITTEKRNDSSKSIKRKLPLGPSDKIKTKSSRTLGPSLHGSASLSIPKKDKKENQIKYSSNPKKTNLSETKIRTSPSLLRPSISTSIFYGNSSPTDSITNKLFPKNSKQQFGASQKSTANNGLSPKHYGKPLLSPPSRTTLGVLNNNPNQLHPNSAIPNKNQSTPIRSEKLCHKMSLRFDDIVSPISKTRDFIVKKKPHTVGFSNMGNTCYLNSTIQVLCGLIPFCEDVLAEEPAMSYILPSLQLLLKSRSQCNSELVSAALRALRLGFIKFIDKAFMGDDQQDASEFLNKLLVQLNDDITANRSSFLHGNVESTFIEDNFEVTILEKHSCNTCDNSRKDNQKHMLLYAALTENDNEIEDALHLGGKKSIQNLVDDLLKSQSIKCTHCPDGKSLCETKLVKLPRVVIVQLKRYNNKSEKIMTPVKISPFLVLDQHAASDCVSPKPARLPATCDVGTQYVPQDIVITPDTTTELEDEDLKKAMDASLAEKEKEEQELQEALRRSVAESNIFECDENKEASEIWNPPKGTKHCYRLMSTVIHKGLGSSSGHYVAHVYHSEPDGWFCYNDEFVSNISESTLMGLSNQETCYYLLYMHSQIFEEIQKRTHPFP